METDAIEISAGLAVSVESSPTQIGKTHEGFYADYALKIASQTDISIISVGGYRSIQMIEDTLNKRNVIAISMPLLSFEKEVYRGRNKCTLK